MFVTTITRTGCASQTLTGNTLDAALPSMSILTRESIASIRESLDAYGTATLVVPDIRLTVVRY